MPLLDYEPTITCPYNETHQILPSRMQYHLTRCSRNYPNSGLQVCPFNTCHRIPKSELQFHIETCEDRKILEIKKYEKSEGGDKKETFKPSSVSQQYADNCEEDWERELVSSSYDPIEACKKKAVLLQPKNLTKSQRKMFYANEKLRHREINNKTSEDGSDFSDNHQDIPGLHLRAATSMTVNKKATAPPPKEEPYQFHKPSLPLRIPAFPEDETEQAPSVEAIKKNAILRSNLLKHWTPPKDSIVPGGKLINSEISGRAPSEATTGVSIASSEAGSSLPGLQRGRRGASWVLQQRKKMIPSEIDLMEEKVRRMRLSNRQ